MTNFFGFNITKGEEYSDIDGDIFLSKTISEEQRERLNKVRMRNNEFENKFNLPTPFGILKFICLFGWVTFGLGILKSDVGFKEGYRNAPLLHWIGAILFVAWIVLLIYEKIRIKKTVSDENFNAHIEEINTILNSIKQELNIPENAVSIDVLAENYIIKDGEPKHKDFRMTNYINFDLSIFKENGNLYLSDIEQVWEIPLTSLRSISLVKKRVSFPEWHKSESYDADKYKKYKITTNQFGHCYSFYYRIQISDVCGEFYILVPEYDGDIFMTITDMCLVENAD